MKEGLEIERKFLLKQIPFPYINAKGLEIAQYYVQSGDDRFRVRETYHHPGITYDKTYKEKLRAGVYQEKVIDISNETFMDLARQAHRFLTKKRIHAPHTNDGLKWEIDVLSGPKKLIVAEIEIPSEDYPLVIPDFIQEVMIMEVTKFNEFTNYALSDPTFPSTANG